MSLSPGDIAGDLHSSLIHLLYCGLDLTEYIAQTGEKINQLEHI
jgi:hypothetical protein